MQMAEMNGATMTTRQRGTIGMLGNAGIPHDLSDSARCGSVPGAIGKRAHGVPVPGGITLGRESSNCVILGVESRKAYYTTVVLLRFACV